MSWQIEWQAFRKGLLFTVLCGMLCSGGSAQAAETYAWPMFQYNPQHSGQVQRPAISKPKLLWKAPVGVTGWLNSPVIDQQRVFVPSSGQLWNMPDQSTDARHPGDGVMAFELETGKRLWVHPAQNDVNQVVLAAGSVIATGAEGAIWALDPATGEEHWRQELGAEGFQILAVPGPTGAQVVVGTGKGQLFWLDADSGQILRRSQLDGAIRAGVSWDGERFFAATIEGSVYAFDATGELVWQQSLRSLYPDLIDPDYPFRPEIYGSPTVYKDFVILGFARDSYYDSPALLALDRKNGKLRWKGVAYANKSEWGNIRTSPAIYHNLLLYAEPYSNTIVALDADTGHGLGGQNLGAPMFPQWSSPVVAGSTAYIPRFDGGLYALDANNGNILWQFYLGSPGLAGPDLPQILRDWANSGETGWRPPIGDAIYTTPALAADGRLLLPAAGMLYCLGQDDGK